MHISQDGIADSADRALLRAVLRTGARLADGTGRAPPTLQERFGVAPPASHIAVAGPPAEDRGRLPSRPSARGSALEEAQHRVAPSHGGVERLLR